MYRFFVTKKGKNDFILSKETLNHIKAIRLKKNEKFYCIYNNEYYLCFLENEKAKIVKKENINNEYKNKIFLFAAIINIKKFEWLIQKAAELGVKHFFPMITDNTNKKYIEQINFKLNRFIEIAKNACEQSFRNQIMNIHKPINFCEAINFDIKNKYIAHEKKDDFNLIENDIFFENDIAFYVGPEGGFTTEEISKSVSKSIKIIFLGKRILRSETASIFLLSRIKNSN